MLALRNNSRFPSLQSLFDDVFSNGRMQRDGESTYDFDVDLKETEDAYIVKAEMPGIKKEDLSVNVENNILTIEFSKQAEKNEKNENYHLQEMKWGKFSRAFSLPKNVDQGEVNAVLKDGILSLEIKKSAAAKRKLIEVKVE
jgi:HSP20 family protein